MGAFVCFPDAFTLVDAAAQATTPASNMGWDDPGLIYRSTSVTPSITVLSQCATPIDTVALVATNLRIRDMVRIRIGASQAEVDGAAPIDITMPAWSGAKSDLSKAMTVLRLPAPVQGKYVRVDITATGHPDGYVQIGRLVIGSSATNSFGAVGQDVETSINDGSESYEYRGVTGWDKFAKTQTFKAPFSHIGEVQYRREWFPLLSKAGNSNAVLMVPQYDLKPNVNMLADPLNQASSWTSSGALSWARNVDYAPDGSMTASIISDTSTSASYYVKSTAIPADILPYTGSVYVKKAANAPIFGMLIECIDTTGTVASTSASVFIDPSSGRTNPATQVVDMGDYWRIWRPVSNSNANTTVRLRVYPAHAAPGGTPGTSNGAVMGSNTFWGAQITAGSDLLDWTLSSAAAAMDSHFADYQQSDAVFGYISKATPKWSAPYFWNIDLTVTSTAL